MKKRIPLVYIAGRFRGEDNAAIQRHIDVAAMFRAPIAKLKCMPVCVHIGEGLAMHDINQENNGEWWLESTLEVLRRCDAVVLVPGWESSAGTLGEFAEARRLDLPVFVASFVQGEDMPTPTDPDLWRTPGTWDTFADWVADLTVVSPLSERTRAALSQADGEDE